MLSKIAVVPELRRRSGLLQRFRSFRPETFAFARTWKWSVPTVAHSASISDSNRKESKDTVGLHVQMFGVSPTVLAQFDLSASLSAPCSWASSSPQDTAVSYSGPEHMGSISLRSCGSEIRNSPTPLSSWLPAGKSLQYRHSPPVAADI